jgi:hypothetical protein
MICYRYSWIFLFKSNWFPQATAAQPYSPKIISITPIVKITIHTYGLAHKFWVNFHTLSPLRHKKYRSKTIMSFFRTLPLCILNFKNFPIYFNILFFVLTSNFFRSLYPLYRHFSLRSDHDLFSFRHHDTIEGNEPAEFSCDSMHITTPYKKKNGFHLFFSFFFDFVAF